MWWRRSALYLCGMTARSRASKQAASYAIPPIRATRWRWKQVIGDGLRFHSDEARATEVAIAAQVLNRMLDLGCPDSVRVA
jgi:hypothetical protein